MPSIIKGYTESKHAKQYYDTLRKFHTCIGKFSPGDSFGENSIESEFDTILGKSEEYGQDYFDGLDSIKSVEDHAGDLHERLNRAFDRLNVLYKDLHERIDFTISFHNHMSKDPNPAMKLKNFNLLNGNGCYKLIGINLEGEEFGSGNWQHHLGDGKKIFFDFEPTQVKSTTTCKIEGVTNGDLNKMNEALLGFFEELENMMRGVDKAREEAISKISLAEIFVNTHKKIASQAGNLTGGSGNN